SVFTIIANMQRPAIPPGGEPSDWAAVCIQIRTEVSYLVQLYDFQNNLQLGTLAVNQAMANSFAMAPEHDQRRLEQIALVRSYGVSYGVELIGRPIAILINRRSNADT